MIFHTKCGILLVLCTIRYTMKQCVAEDTSMTSQNANTDEEDAIKEALLLVELLKNAQDKALLRTIDTTVEESTCAATTLESLSTPVYNETSSSINLETTTEASMLSTPNEQFPQYRRAFMPNWPRMHTPHAYHDHHHPRNDDHHFRRDVQEANFYGPRGFFRRRFPDYFYFQNYFDFPRVNNEKPIPGFRRVQYDEIQTSSSSPVTVCYNCNFGKIDVTTTTTTVSPLTSTTKSMTKKTQKWGKKSQPIRKKPVATMNKRAISKKFNPKFEKIGRQLRDNTTKGPLNTTTETTLGLQKIATPKKVLKAIKEQKKTTESKVSHKDPVMDEIASEFIKELNGSKIVDKVMNKVTKPEKFRSTLRIHLDGSTRYSIPLPENHAFCFLNPESLLCRTP